jgi:hypothetical protein
MLKIQQNASCVDFGRILPKPNPASHPQQAAALLTHAARPHPKTELLQLTNHLDANSTKSSSCGLVPGQSPWQEQDESDDELVNFEMAWITFEETWRLIPLHVGYPRP